MPLRHVLASLAGFALVAGLWSAPTAARKPAPAAQPEQPAPAPAPKKLLDLPYLQRDLDNGLRVIVIQARFKDTVSVQIPMQTGSRNEIEDGKTGFAHFFEHMMFRGTEKYPADAYGAVIKAAGADQNAYTDDDYTNYYTNFTTADLERILEVEADRFANLKFSEEQFRTEALAVKGEYLKNFSNPLAKGFERLQDIAYTTHTYKHNAMGFFKDIEAMPDQIAYAHTFFDRWYRPEYATVIVTGDVELEPTFELVKKYFGGWQRGNYKIEIPTEPAQTEARYEHVAWQGPTLPWILVGWKSPAFDAKSPEFAAMAVLGEEYFGTTSELYKKIVVKERWVDQLFFQPSRNVDSGLTGLAVRLTDAKHAPAVTAAIQDAVFAARTRLIDAKKLADTKSALKYGFAAGLNSSASVGAIVASFAHYERDLETINRYYATFDALTPEQVRAAADRVFTDGQRSVVSIANGEALAGANDFRAIDGLVAGARQAAPAKADVVKEEKPAAPTRDNLEHYRLVNYANESERWSADEMVFTVPVVEQPSDSPLIDLVVMVDAGAALDPNGKKGLAALTASLLTQGGSDKRSFDEIQAALYPYAAPLTVQVDKEMIKFAGTVHRDNVKPWWTTVMEQIATPGFREDDFQRVKQAQINAIRVSLRANNDEELAKEALYEKVYGPDHPYGTLTLGKLKDVESITLDDVRDFYNKFIQRGRITVGIAGGYTPEFRSVMLAPLVQIGFQKKRPLDVPAAPVPTKRTATIIQKEAPAVAVSFGAPLTIKRGDPDWLALWLVRSWLGEHRNSSAHLYNRIREARGMNYGDYAYIEYFPYGMYLMQPQPNFARRNDLFQIWLRPLRDNNDAVFATRAALFEIEKLVKNGMSAEQFEASRAFLSKFVTNLTATQTRQLGYAFDSSYYGTPEFKQYVRDGLAALTLDKVNAAIRAHIKPEQFQFVFVAKDAAGLAKALSSGAPSPIKYNSDKPADLLAEDKVIQKYPLKLAPKDVRVVQDTTLFE